jgi:hypothetical protein
MFQVDNQDCNRHVYGIQGRGNPDGNSGDQQYATDKFNQGHDHSRNHGERNTGVRKEARNPVEAHMEKLLVTVDEEHDSDHDPKDG